MSNLVKTCVNLPKEDLDFLKAEAKRIRSSYGYVLRELIRKARRVSEERGDVEHAEVR